MRILIIDNYDSFVYNLVQYVGELGAEPLVYRNDSPELENIGTLNVKGIVISPGPGTPEVQRDIGHCKDVIKKQSGKVPILGVCLGHQAIVNAFGGKIIRADRIMHGKTSYIAHDEDGLFRGVKNPLKVMRYHSLIADPDNFPSEELRIVSRTIKGDEIFAVRHKLHPVFGVQFHPESIGTEEGKSIIKNFLEVCDDR